MARNERTSDPALLRAARREFFSRLGLGLGIGRFGLWSLLSSDGVLAAAPQGTDPMLPRPPHFPAKAKSVIHLFMAGGPSQLELFDPKPKLNELHGQTIPESFIENKRFAFLKKDPKLLGIQRKFQPAGDSGAQISECLLHIAGIVDDIAIIRTAATDVFNHGPAKCFFNTGSPRFGRPSMGAWVTYGLGSESRDLPGYVMLQSGPRGPRGGTALYSSGFLPTVYQAVPFRSSGDPILNLASPPSIDRTRQRQTLEAIADLNRANLDVTDDPEIATRIASYEMAYRMQESAPELIDLSDETQETLDLYGASPEKPSFARNCLLARRLVERGCRFVLLFHTDWDHHGGKNADLGDALTKVTGEVDQPSAALVQDLKRRGMLDETLVIWSGEFGRTPMGEARETTGRDHHIDAFSLWLAGGGIRGGQVIGKTDELGFYPVEDRVHVHDLQATLLHLLGLDHERLTYRFQGRDFRLTDVAGEVVQKLLA